MARAKSGHDKIQRAKVSEKRELVHGTCVALGSHAALLRGRSGSGKTDLALRFLALPSEPGLEPGLVADDQVWVEAKSDGSLIASPPPTLAGKIEVRGLGILDVPHRGEARLALVVDLVVPQEVPRMPPDPPAQITIAGATIPVVKLAPFELSSALKLKLALLSAVSQSPHQQA
jgi:serine kinase of HPr protein (carbohydrate metabolism regulator)